jgi:hypothetical protein
MVHQEYKMPYTLPVIIFEQISQEWFAMNGCQGFGHIFYYGRKAGAKPTGQQQ